VQTILQKSFLFGHEVSMSFLAETWLFWSLFILGLVLFRQARRSLVGQFLFERFLLALFTLLLVSIVIFAVMEAVPGDCATRMIAYKNTQGTVITDADIQAERKLRGLDGAVYERWGSGSMDWLPREIWDFHVKKEPRFNKFWGIASLFL
jgi:peptide/nickel transport system permease protein